MRESLGDTADHAAHHNENAEILFEHQEPLLSRQPSPTRGQSNQGGSDKITASCSNSEDTMLLEKPSTLSRTLDLDKGYEYGPAVQFAPGFFTKMPGKQAPIHRNEQPQGPDNDPSPPLSQARHDHGLSPNSRPAGKTISRQSHPVESSVRPGAQPPITGLPFGETLNNKPNGGETIVLKQGSQVVGQPPFPDTSPKQPARPAVQARVQKKSATASTTGETRAGIPIPGPAMTSNLGWGQESCVSPHTTQVREAIPHHSPPGRDRPTPFGTAELGERDGRVHRSPMPPAGSSRYSAREPADRARNHMVNRPMREAVHSRPARSVHRARPESRSSNVSKQRLVYLCVAVLFQILTNTERSRCGSLASSPMVRQRRVNISHEFTTGLAGVINQFTQQQNAALEEQKAKYHKYIKRLRTDLAQESGVVARQLSEIDAQSKDMEALQASKEHLASQLHDIEAKLAASDDRARRLEEKYRSCKTHLNSAIQEQQDLYTRSKQQWEEALEQVRVLGKSQSVDAEMAVRKAEVIREEMIEKVRQTIAQNKSESLECKCCVSGPHTWKLTCYQYTVGSTP